jgi:hypothetical protein
VLLERDEAANERRGEHPAEVGDHRLDHAASGGTSRIVTS